MISIGPGITLVHGFFAIFAFPLQSPSMMERLEAPKRRHLAILITTSIMESGLGDLDHLVYGLLRDLGGRPADVNRDDAVLGIGFFQGSQLRVEHLSRERTRSHRVADLDVSVGTGTR